MKKLLATVLIFGGLQTLGQELTTPKDSTKLNPLTAFSVTPPPPNTNTYTPNLTLPTPQATSLGSYGNAAINLSTGLPAPNISLLELTEGETKLDIGTSYLYRGFKPFEAPSLLGRGWSLNAGGLITRVIKSRADETIPTTTPSDNYGYASAQNRTNLANLINNDGSLVSAGGQSLFYSIPDGEPDTFIFNFLGMSGKFFFGEDGAIHVVSDRKLKIEYTVVQLNQAIGNNTNTDKYHLVKFVLIDENGTRYTFGDASTTVNYPVKNVEFSTTGSNYECGTGKMNISAWYLTEIMDKNGHTITFSYTNDYMYQIGNTVYFDYNLRGRNIASPVTRGQYNTASQAYFYDNMWSCVGSYENFLTTITATNWTVNFEYNKTGAVTYLSKTRLKANTNPLQEVKNFTFNYLNLANPDGLLLENIIEASPDNTITKTHSFAYNTPTGLNYNNFYGIDHWGYDNGASTNSSLIPNAPFNANRAPNFNATVKGALTSITYPTGGSTHFAYELNEYGQLRESDFENGILINKRPYGGLRVTTITDKDVDGTTLLQKSYNYNSVNNANKSSGVISSSIGLTSIISNGTFTSPVSGGPSFPTLPNGTIYFSEGFHSMAETPIYYTSVIETLSNGTTTQNTFTSHNDYNDYLGLNYGRGNDQVGSAASYVLMRALPKTTKYFKNSILVKEVIHNYNLVDRHKARSIYTGNATATNAIQQTIDFVKTYYTYAGWLQKTSETERIYSDASNYIETATSYNYDNTTYLQPTAITTSGSKGESLLKELKYPYDFNTEPYLTMVSKNIIAPVIEEQSYSDGQPTVWKFTDYAHFGSLQLPEKIRTKIGSGTIITPITFNSYDSRGNLTQYSTRSGQTTSMTYFGINDLGKTDLLSSQTIGGGLNGTVLSRTSSFDYIPMVGTSAETDINDYTTRYFYDAFSRLKYIKDPADSLIKDFAYHYANQPAVTGLGISPSNNQNYIVSRTARIAQVGTSLSSDENQTSTQINYMDGLGRATQALVWKGSPDKSKDIILATTEYDSYGRAYKTILPTPSDGAAGAYKSNAQSLANTFYNNSYPYAETIFENSPLNRPIKQFGAGAAWRNLGNEKYIEMQYLTAGAAVKRFDIQANGTITGANSYPNNALYSQAIISENGNYTYELKDKQGRTTHKIQQLEDASYATTAYCYNYLGQLVAVLSPKAYQLFAEGNITSLTETDNIYLELAFGYHYDDLGRLVEKHTPGAGWTRLVYDKNDRIVLKNDDQDGNIYWQFTKYDGLGRPVMTGLLPNLGSTSRQSIQNDFDNFTGNTFEQRGGSLYNYTNASYPSGAYAVAEANLKLVNYYDDHSWVGSVNPSVAAQANELSVLPVIVGVKGLLTGTLVRNLETDAWYKSTKYYDYRGRNTINFQASHLGGINRTDYMYSFANDLLKIKMEHQGILEIYDYTYDHLGRKKSFRHTKNGFAQNIAQYAYDDIGRLSLKTFSPAGTNMTTAQTGLWTEGSSWQSGFMPTMNDVATVSPGHTVTVNSTESVSAGKLVVGGAITNNGTINVGNLLIPRAAALQTINYQYHIRGGLRGINLDGSGNLTNSLFSYKLGFEDDGSYFDGNIRKQEWRSSMDNNTRSFTYSYDAASRIKSGAFVGNGAENYSLINVNYDENGNISALSRNGFKANNTFGQVDNLSYIYFGNSNKIQQVDDLSGEAASLSDSPGTDYTYYPDGSLQSDANKGISLIEYNYLKLPKRIVMGSTTILNQYDAGGKKLKETIGTNTRDYVDNLVFENGTLQQLSHDEGRLVGTTHEYYIKDHLGSLRVAFKDSAGVAKVTQKHDYGVWGESLPTLSYKNTNKLDPYKFTGKEALTETGFIDFGARLFDNVVPRFISVDPLADITKNLSSSSFAYVANNPISRIDPDGKDWFYYQTLGEKKKSWHWQDGNVATYTNTKGKTVSTKNGFDYLVTFKITGKNSEGSTTGILQVWGDRDPKKGALITSTGFTGSSKFQGTEPIPKGNYMMKLGKRDSDGPNGFKQDESGPIPFDGIQAIPNNEKFVHNGYVYPNNPWFTNAYGNGRIRLNQTDENLNPIPMINQPAGYYLHGKKDAHNWTHGCICDKSEAIFNFLWKSQIRVNVPFNVD